MMQNEQAARLEAKAGDKVGGLQTSRPSVMLGFALALCSVPSVMSAVVLVPILPELFRTYATMPNASFWVPALITIPGLCTALLSPLAGFLGDRLGLKWPIACSLILFSLFGAAPLFLSDFSLILVTRVGVGASQAVAVVLSIALIGQQFDGVEREKWLAIQTVAATSSSLVLLPLSGFLAQLFGGWHSSFFVFLSGFVLAIAVARLSIQVPKQPEATDKRNAAVPWAWLLTQCFVTLLVAVLFFAIQFQLGLALSALGVERPGVIGLLSGVAASGTMLGSALFVSAKRWLGVWLLPTELLISGVTLVLMTESVSVITLVSLAFLNMVACGLMLPTLITAVAVGLPEGVRGRGLGLWNSAFTFGQFLSAAIIGAVLARPSNNIFDAFALLGIGALVMAIAGFFLSWRSRA